MENHRPLESSNKGPIDSDTEDKIKKNNPERGASEGSAGTPTAEPRLTTEE